MFRKIIDKIGNKSKFDKEIDSNIKLELLKNNQNKKYKYFILGSCVTRDIFNFVSKDDYTIVDYYARTKMSSLISKSLEIQDEDIHLESSFQKKIVKKDLNKTFFEDLKNTNFDYLIIDLIDERFDLFKVGNSYITISNEFRNSKLEETLNGEKIQKSLEEWKKDCEIFSKELLSIIPKDKIIIHHAIWANLYIENDKIYKFEQQRAIEKNNSLLGKYYKILENCLSGCRVIHYESELLANAEHQWGLSPFHFEDEYYRSMSKKIINLKS